MKLSILIPIYNWNVSRLYEKLLNEICRNNLSDDVELILADDCSTDPAVINVNKEIAKNNTHKYVRFENLKANLGRSGIRNWLAERSTGDFLLFLDCDVLPDDDNFIRHYLGHISQNTYDVVCGGRSYKTRILTDKQYDFHEYFGNKKEVKSAHERNITPWRYILTSNIMIRKSAYVCTHFNESFVGYGYEDVEWAIRLSQSYKIMHIDNNASHLGLVSKKQAYEKMKESVNNYLLLRELHPMAFDAALISRFMHLFCNLTIRSLRVIDRILTYVFFQKWLNKWVAFVVYQLDFAVMLSLCIKGDERQKN